MTSAALSCVPPSGLFAGRQTVPYFPFCLKKASLQQGTGLIYPFWDLPCDSVDFLIGTESSCRTAETLSMPLHSA